MSVPNATVKATIELMIVDLIAAVTKNKKKPTTSAIDIKIIW